WALARLPRDKNSKREAIVEPSKNQMLTAISPQSCSRNGHSWFPPEHPTAPFALGPRGLKVAFDSRTVEIRDGNATFSSLAGHWRGGRAPGISCRPWKDLVALDHGSAVVEIVFSPVQAELLTSRDPLEQCRGIRIREIPAGDIST